ncbi:ABC transporter ATP-binding protein [Haloferula sargassicola]|uniref:ABC transporter ATP-binding protein n=1 Tax=Haloferula sargassicola TaxID=490096 RepID=A0ABP9UN19_9BACT
MKVTLNHSSRDFCSYRAQRVKSLFNCEDGHRFTANFELPIDGSDWSIGLVVGPSGSGKSSLGRHLGELFTPDWPHDAPLIDTIAPGADFDQVTAALTAVGLGSVPTWLRPYRVLSNGEQFRANLARLVADPPDHDEPVVIDEFTSVVDRQIARIGAAAFAKAWRRTGRRVVLLTCHYDVAEWLCPDWILDTATGQFSGDCLRRRSRRPSIDLEIRRVPGALWRHFEPHHYLKLPNMVAAQHYAGFVGQEPVAHLAFSPQFNLGPFIRACRLVVMPEWQGAGVGLAFLEECCRAMLHGKNKWGRPCFTNFHTSHPGLVAALRKRPAWLHISAGLFGDDKSKSYASMAKSGSAIQSGFGGHLRAVHGFKYIGTEAL